MSIVTGSSNTVYGIDNDLGYVVWQRRFGAALPAPTASCPGGISAGATRLVQARRNGLELSRVRRRAWCGRLSQRARRARARRAARSARPRTLWRSLASPERRARCPRRWCRGTASASRYRRQPARGGQPDDRIPGSPRREEARRIRVPVPPVRRRLRDHERRPAARARSAVREGHAAPRAVPAGQREMVVADRDRHDVVRRHVRRLRRRAARGLGDRSGQRRRSRWCRGRPTADRSWERWRSRPTARCSPRSAPVRPPATARRTRSSRSIRRPCE